MTSAIQPKSTTMDSSGNPFFEKPIEKLKGKTVSDSACQRAEVFFLKDLNPNRTVLGGRMLEIADYLTALVAYKHARRPCATRHITARFIDAPGEAELVLFRASVNRVWKTSMEVGISATKEKYTGSGSVPCFAAYVTLTILNDPSKPAILPPVIPETQDERRRYLAAEERRERSIADPLQNKKSKVAILSRL
jgi:acyl-CoA hydrolase